MNLEESLSHLRHIDQWRVFLDEVDSRREDAIAQLYGRQPHEVNEIAGYIRALTDILEMSGHREMKTPML